MNETPDGRPVLIIPFWHPTTDEAWQLAFPNRRIVRQVENLPTKADE